MVVRNNDSRRRRIVVDPSHQREDSVAATLPVKRTPRRPSRLYKAGSERRHQWKTTDLLPKRGWTVTLVVGLVLFAVSLMNVFAVHSPKWTETIGSPGAASLQLSGRSTLAAWFSSFLLIISGFASLQIYALRQHRKDDYRGSYRLWLWMAALLLLASVNCIVDLTGIAVELVRTLTSLSFSQSLLSVVVFKLVLLSGLVARGSFEMRESKAALSLVVLVWVAYAGAAVLSLPAAQPVLTQMNMDENSQHLVKGNLALLGPVALFLSLVFFARSVYLQALGVVKSKPRTQKTTKAKAKPRASSKKKSASKPKSTRTAKQTETPDVEEVQESKSQIKLPIKPQTKSQTQPVKSEDQEESDTDEGVIRLSKSQLRRQKKQQSQNQNRRAA